MEPETAEAVSICGRLEKAATRVKIRQDLQHANVKAWARDQPLTLEQYDAMNKCEDEITELVPHQQLDDHQRDADKHLQSQDRTTMHEILAMDLKSHMMQFQLFFADKVHFHRHQVCDKTCLQGGVDDMSESTPSSYYYSLNPRAHPLADPSQVERIRQRTPLIKDLFYSCHAKHRKQVANIVKFLEQDFMQIQVTSERARRVLVTHFRNPYLVLFDHMLRQTKPTMVDPHIYQYVESAMDNVYLSAYYRVEAKRGPSKKTAAGEGGEDGYSYAPDEKDIGERYCGICDKWFKTRNHNWASHMTSTHGVCSATKSIYPFPVAVILGVPSTTQKEDELVVYQKISFVTNPDGDLQIQNDSQPRHHLLPDKDIKLSGLCAICCHYVPLYCKRGATVWTTWFRHQDKHIREFNQERNGGVAVNLNNPRNNKTRKEELSKERMRAWKQQQEERTRKKIKHDDNEMAFLEQGVVVDHVQSSSGSSNWLNEEFAMTQAEVTLSYQMEYQQGESEQSSGQSSGQGSSQELSSSNSEEQQYY